MSANRPLTYTGTVKVATVQAEPVILNADATIDKAIGYIEEAAKNGAEFIAFPEVFIPGYPYWAWIGDVKWAVSEFIPRYHEESLTLGDDRMRRLQRLSTLTRSRFWLAGHGHRGSCPVSMISSPRRCRPRRSPARRSGPRRSRASKKSSPGSRRWKPVLPARSCCAGSTGSGWCWDG